MTHTLDITGKVCPICLLTVDKELKKLSSGEDLVVVCDHAPAATASIPEYCGDRHFGCSVKLIENGLWEITITKN
ncbi:sulfurtransferase TusA family protein [Methanocorpusculum vombati]|uniref:Sulfurtransferase TusA family protein n=1 Tax=Methanocorpusculum vombati TaxID=3002864 RepID=A0ABT4ILB7_9EURY|nr:sulfurtransferase TusA family protein [Methanocorpusculum vombati]MCZ9311979.1 sulfurtransferase TusA family protein [Methanocorpusculum sp.]MCZ0862537.1 sulfurtransferase TusA family protein [Methanocorpusculum vombati]MCZ9318800.1 sulfurtransferase TusA family protein [Methanocorpusculum sp.]MDE2521442.1 sulfurtransferase TusA family protein [Methanocorpusculum sp.]MDE2533928.1 sulfurtransferase TusA family protein [Methanocorpusculum sp.]